MTGTEHMIQGSQLLKKQRPLEALSQFILGYEKGEQDGSAWHKIGQAYEALGQPLFAYVAYREAASMLTGGHSTETRQLFQSSLQRVQRHWREASDLSLEDVLRAPKVEVEIEHGLRKDVYRFVEIPADVVAATAGCNGIRAYFDRSKDAYSAGDLRLAAGIMLAAVNASVSHDGKASALYMAARLALEGQQDLVTARRYLGWAAELNPDDEDVRKLRDYLSEFE